MRSFFRSFVRPKVMLFVFVGYCRTNEPTDEQPPTSGEVFARAESTLLVAAAVVVMHRLVVHESRECCLQLLPMLLMLASGW